MDLPFLLYGLGLVATMFAVALTAIARPNWPLSRSALAVLFNWMVGTAYVAWTGITDAWRFNIAIDLATALVIVFHTRSRWQIALVATYCIQIVMHGYYGLKALHGATLPWSYYGALTAIAWLQLLLLLGWAVETWITGARRGRRR